MKFISYSLFGDNERYLSPLLEIAQANCYQGWSLVVYHDDTVPSAVLADLKSSGVLLMDVSGTHIHKINPRMWRLFAVDIYSVDAIIFRDSDSSLTQREKVLVDEWIEGEYGAHIIRDHPLHVSPIMAGMFGLKKNHFAKLNELLANKFCLGKRYNTDQIILNDKLYPAIRADTLVHTSFFKFKHEHSVPIECPIDDNFIGKVIGGEDPETYRIFAYGYSGCGFSYGLSKYLRYKVRPTLFFNKLFKGFINE